MGTRVGYPLVICYIANWKDPPFFMGKSTISMAIFNSFLYVYQRVWFSVKMSFDRGKTTTKRHQPSTKINSWWFSSYVWLPLGTCINKGKNSKWAGNRFLAFKAYVVIPCYTVINAISMVWVLEYVGISWALQCWRNAHLQQYPAESVTWDEAILLVSVGSCNLCGFVFWPVLISSNMPTLRVLLNENVFKCPISPKSEETILYINQALIWQTRWRLVFHMVLLVYWRASNVSLRIHLTGLSPSADMSQRPSTSTKTNSCGCSGCGLALETHIVPRFFTR